MLDTDKRGAPITFTCECQRDYVMSAGAGLPPGWEARTVHKRGGGSYAVLICVDCVAFHDARCAAEVDRIHDSSSAVDDEPALTPLTYQSRYGLWQAVLTFHTDKGVVESTVIIGGDNPVQAIMGAVVTVNAAQRAELFSIKITPAPLNVPQSAADRIMRPKAHQWPKMGIDC